MAEPRKFHCIGCRKRVTATSDDHYRKHDREKGTECARSKRDIPTWLLRRGPETEPETDTPVKGRDYADCPQCGRSPLLREDTGAFALHIKDPGMPNGEREQCPMGGEPYTPEGAACETNTANRGAASPSTAAPMSVPRDDARPLSQPESSTNQSEEMISQWAATAREIEERKQSPESTTTPQDSPPRPDAPEAPPAPAAQPRSSATTESVPGRATTGGSAEDAAPALAGASPSPHSTPQRPCHIAKDHGPHKWMYQRRQAQCPGKPAPGGRNELGVAAVARLSRKSAPTPGVTPADSAAPPAAGAPAPKTVKDSAPETAASPATEAVPTPTTAATATEPLFAQPGSPFSQPAKPSAAAPAVPMSLHGEQIAARLKEMFFAYSNRTDRSIQKSLGPSEIGTPCERRIAMSLLRVRPVNPGGDNWASFVGTCVHQGLAEMFQWADAGQGRFAVEIPLTFSSEHVPKGTADLLDRTLCMVDDHKALGRWSLNKLKSEGPSSTYRVQVHTYAYGMRLKGEAVDHVALVAWPREASSLDDLYVWTEPYDPAIARDALARVDRIATEVQAHQSARGTWAGLDIAAHHLRIAREFSVADDCVWCPFYAPGDAEGTRGCNGRQ